MPTAHRVLILGASGMLGHKLLETLAGHFTAAATVRKITSELANRFPKTQLIEGVFGEDFGSINAAVTQFRPDTVINCIGIVKQLTDAKDAIKSIEINALLPHRVAEVCRQNSARFIHISTDCVFDGKRGNYSESDPTTGYDLYARSKALGEVTGDKTLTLRTSIIGPQLVGQYGLLEWVLAQKGKTCSGYTKAIFSGLPTIALANVIKEVVGQKPNLEGLFHVAAQPINKHDLLHIINAAYGLGLNIVPDDTVQIDRSLNGQKFFDATGIRIVAWPKLIDEMAEDDQKTRNRETAATARGSHP